MCQCRHMACGEGCFAVPSMFSHHTLDGVIKANQKYSLCKYELYVGAMFPLVCYWFSLRACRSTQQLLYWSLPCSHLPNRKKKKNLNNWSHFVGTAQNTRIFSINSISISLKSHFVVRSMFFLHDRVTPNQNKVYLVVFCWSLILSLCHIAGLNRKKRTRFQK